MRNLITIAHPHLQRLADAVRETTHLMVLEGNGSRFLDGVEGSQALRRGMEAGEPVHVEPTSIADGLNAPFAGRHVLATCGDRVESVLVTEERSGGVDTPTQKPFLSVQS